MPDHIDAADSPASIAGLVGGIVTDLQTLIRQQLLLAKSEMRQEWDKTKSAASSMVAGASLLAAAGLLLCFAMVYLLATVATGLPLWACFGIVAVVLGLIGGILVAAGRNQATDIHIVPPQTAETLRENAQWLRNQT
jgi:hypothetical protein